MARLLFFGKLADIAGARMRDYSLAGEGHSLADLIAALSADEPALGAALVDLKVRYLVNEEMARDDMVLSDQDEIAFLPPVSGG